MSGNHTLRLRPDKVGSVCLPFDLGPYVSVRPEPLCREGASVACRVRSIRSEYGDLELPSGRMARLALDDIIVGVLGNRAALRGFSGRVPGRLSEGDHIHLLNQGGVLGVAEGAHAGLGRPIELEVLGTLVRAGTPLQLMDFALGESGPLPETMPPLLIVAGTCMHAGKSTAAAAIIRSLRARGRVVHAGKATGVASIQDLVRFRDAGALKALSFLECGLPSTCHHPEVPQMARTLLGHLAQESPDAIVIEMGDGLMGAYGVDALIQDREFNRWVSGAVVAANDIIGAWAAAERIAGLGIEVKVVTGPVTDNAVGVNALAERGYAAANVFLESERLCELAVDGLLPPDEAPP